MQAVILAGGEGRRLLPYTTVLPKPLMPVGDYSIIEIVLLQLEQYGFTDVTICTGYMHKLIHAFLDTNKIPGLKITYSHENKPLGTIGPLRLIDSLDDVFLVMNGDILTDLDYREFIKFHIKNSAVATIASYSYEVKIDFGVIDHNENNKIFEFREKPQFHFNTSMGIYAFQKKILRYIPKDRPFGLDDLMNVLIAEGAPIYSYPFNGYWRDIGRVEDLKKSTTEFEKNKQLFIKQASN